MTKYSCTFLAMVVVHASAFAQVDILPPVAPWSGKSMELVAKKNNAWITPTEQSDFVNTPSYQETIAWLTKLCAASDVLDITTIGQSTNGRKIEMIIAAQGGRFDKASLRASSKPLLLIQAAIHAGEVDGKDAGMMLLRDIAFGTKKDVLKHVNLLFIPILNVDGHERISPYNRVNQRGPANMGWRTNARNFNLNRDYAKLDTEEIRAVVQVMNDYNPTLCLDLHVTDGVDYQYDITYGYSKNSTNVFQWLDKTLRPTLDNRLKANGHIPGPLMFAANDRDFTKGSTEFSFSPRFSHSYGDLRHIPSVLLENHSLKPFKQRVLGTYVFLENIMVILGKEGAALKKAIQEDGTVRTKEVVLQWAASNVLDTMLLQGIESKLLKSALTNSQYVVWTGKPITQKIPYIRFNTPVVKANRPKAYWVPATYPEVIERLALHGIQMERITELKSVQLNMYRIGNPKFSSIPFEGHFTVSASATEEQITEIFYPGSVRISTDQILGDLLIHLLEPASSDSYFQWGFFPGIFTRTEYIEEYVIEPLAKNMLAQDEKLRIEFEEKKKQDPNFINDPIAVYNWFYSKSPYVDERYLLYPIGIER